MTYFWGIYISDHYEWIYFQNYVPILTLSKSNLGMQFENLLKENQYISKAHIIRAGYRTWKQSNLWTVIYQTYSIVDGFLPDNHPMICEITLMYCMVYWAIHWYDILYVLCKMPAELLRVYVCLDFYFSFEIGLKKLTSKLPMLQYYTCAFSRFHFNFSSKHFTTLYFFSIFRFSLLWRSFFFLAWRK